MRCPKCNSNNVIGASYCTGCGSKLEITSERAHIEAVAEVSHENWQRASRAIGRMLFFFVLVFVASLMFRAYATREVIAEFSASATLPAPAPMSLPTSFIQPPKLAVPTIAVKSVLQAEQNAENVIVDGLAQIAHDRLARRVVMKTGPVMIQGTMLYRDEKEIRVITAWPPSTIRIRVIPMEGVDVEKSELPE